MASRSCGAVQRTTIVDGPNTSQLSAGFARNDWASVTNSAAAAWVFARSAVSRVRAVLDEAHDVRNDHGALTRNDELHVGAVLVLAAVGIEVVVEKNRNLAGDDSLVGCLLRHDGVVLGQRLEVLDGGIEVVQRATHGAVDRDGTGVAHEGTGRIEVAHLSLIRRF